MTTNDNNFFCDNGRCLPSPIPENYFKQRSYEKTNLTIDQCLKSCNKGGIGILTNVENISENIQKENKLYTINNPKTYNTYFIFGILFIIFIIIFIFLILNK